MARRIKEAPTVHRQRIAEAAEELFKEKGIEATSVSLIAQKSGYSKATIYVYFENKEEIVSYLVLKSMKLIKFEIEKKTGRDCSREDNFFGVCEAILSHCYSYPMYFSLLQSTINVDFSTNKYYESEKETYEVGREIQEYLVALFDLKEDAFMKVFTLWGALCGIINMAMNKEEYIKKESGMDKNAYLKKAFEIAYRLV